MRKPNQSFITMLFLLSAALSACGTPQPVPVEETPVSQPTENILSTPTATQTPPRSLVVCLGSEPQTLYPYASGSASMWSVLEAIYDGPFDTQTYTPRPVILESAPSLEDGSIRIQAVEALPGDVVVDTHGNVVTLADGVQVYPTGCASENCAVTSDGRASVQMDQMTVTFKLLAGLKWSDGEPLTAADSLFSYTLDAAPATPTSRYGVERTSAYTAPDETTLEWVGRPGFIDPNPAQRFWLPMPEHAWGNLSAEELLQSDLANRSPLGWGPYTITEWVVGDHLTLQKNPNYFRAAEGLPKFDSLVYRFLGENSAANVSALEAGECDVLDQTTFLDDQIHSLLLLQESGKATPYFASSSEWEHLDFGIRPASYDDLYSPAGGDRPDLFGDARTRQAFTYCLDRPAVNNQLFINRSVIPTTYLPPAHPLNNPGAAVYGYDPATGQKLLEETGWKDDDSNPGTPRIAQGVSNVPDGTVLSVNYWTTEAALRKQSSEILANSLRGCGIQVTLQTFNPAQLFAAGPEGPIFGRGFDLVQFTWENGLQSACGLYMSSNVPAAANQWIGANVSGYANPAFDEACRTYLQSAPGSQQQLDSSAQAQSLFANDLPSVPLYSILSVAATRPDLCGFSLDPSGRSTLANLESFDYGEGCAQ